MQRILDKLLYCLKLYYISRRQEPFLPVPRQERFCGNTRGMIFSSIHDSLGKNRKMH